LDENLELADRIIRLNDTHNHEPTHTDEALLLRYIIEEMKLSAEIDDTRSLQDIYEDGLIDYKRKVYEDEDLLVKFPEFDNLKPTLYKHQKKKYPKLPGSCESIELEREYTQTSDD
jgi:hypothetical protein